MTESSIRRELAAHGSLVYTNVGVSMRPLIRQGRDLLVIRTCTDRLRKYDIPLYQRPSGQYVLHRIVRVLPDGYVLCGDNCTQLEHVTDDQILGVLTALERDGRTIPMTAPSMRLYGRLWVGLYPLRLPVLRPGPERVLLPELLQPEPVLRRRRLLLLLLHKLCR